MEYRAGFVSFVGQPNTGKSSLFNQILGTKLAIVTHKAHTTRYEQLGIFTTNTFQLIMVDTPGWLDAKTALQKHMLSEILRSLQAPDLIVWLLDGAKPLEQMLSESDIKRIQQFQGLFPLVVALNKIDLLNDTRLAASQAYCLQHLGQTPLALSVKHQLGLGDLLEHIAQHLPVHEPYFPPNDITNKTERFIAGEILRKHILLGYKQEIPYHTHVQIASFAMQEGLLHIAAVIYVSRDSQQGILLGKQGLKMRQLGRQARMEMQKFFGEKIYLNIRVKVDKFWASRTKNLQQA